MFRPGLLAVSVLALALQNVLPVAAREGFSESKLRHYLETSLGDKAVQYTSAQVQLAPYQSKAVLVYLRGSEWCGSGGCTLLVLMPRGDSFEVKGDVSITRPPIRVLNHMTHGWHDLGVYVAGGGIIPGYDAALPFDGAKYAENPSVPPAHRILKQTAGVIVIDR